MSTIGKRWKMNLMSPPMSNPKNFTIASRTTPSIAKKNSLPIPATTGFLFLSLQFNSIQFNSMRQTFSSILLNRVEPSFPGPSLQMQSNKEATSAHHEQLRPENSNPAAWEDISSTEVARVYYGNEDNYAEQYDLLNEYKRSKSVKPNNSYETEKR